MSSLYRASRLGPAQKEAKRFVSSLESDKHLFESVIEINQAHIVMLGRRRIIPRKHVRKLLRALARVRSIPKSSQAEDVHVAVEEAVTKRAGKSAGGYLQFAKSRNDQVAAAIRLRLRSELLQIIDLLIDLLTDLQKTIRKHHKTLMIGRTHMQPAEPITYGHYLMAFHDAILRDLQRLEEYYFRLNLSPMGGCALAGTSIAIDRRMVAALLGFNGLVENSLDAVGSRDFALEFLANMSQLAVDISRLTEDFIFYTTPEAGQLQLPDELAFTSSIMPQKKNPDIIELARAKCAIPIGAYSQTATILHSLPSSYNLDLQEITPNIWVSSRAMQDVAGTVRILISRTSVRDVDVNRTDFVMTTATEAANILVTELGIPFRLAHQIVGSAASEFSRDRAKRADSWLDILIQKAREMTGNQSKELKARLARALSVGDIVARKKSLGSPAPRETLRLLRARSVILKRVISRQRMRRNLAASAKTQLRREVLRLGR